MGAVQIKDQELHEFASFCVETVFLYRPTIDHIDNPQALAFKSEFDVCACIQKTQYRKNDFLNLHSLLFILNHSSAKAFFICVSSNGGSADG
jgi:hypothetical protein